jgi:2-keto-4-pentenoate hydratase/2-oxohepta-3-ene-1,7-dioic acid hydratase in catechol pathway
MKLVTFAPFSETPAFPRVGVVTAESHEVVDLDATESKLDGRRSGDFVEMLAFLDAGEAARDRAERVVEFALEHRPPQTVFPIHDVQLFSPVLRPRSIRDCMAFEQHLVRATRTVIKWKCAPLAYFDRCVEKLSGKALFGAPRVWYERPIYYKGNPYSVIGHDADVRWPRFTEKLDFELEFGIVLGRRGSNIPEGHAKHFIGGYTIFNDFSARDVQLREMQGRLGPAKSKDFDTGNVLGPYLVTPDEVPDPQALTMTARVNGEEWSRGNSRQMHYSFEEIIAYISRDETLHPGEFIGSGTVPSGCGLELDRWISPGDIIELEVQGLGVLRNQVVRQAAPV